MLLIFYPQIGVLFCNVHASTIETILSYIDIFGNDLFDILKY